MNYRDWMHGHDLKHGDLVKMLNCSYEDGEIIWKSALKYGTKKTARNNQIVNDKLSESQTT